MELTPARKGGLNMQSIVSYPERGNYGKSSYRGNCSGKLIEDIIDQYGLTSLSDFMVGSGTTEDVVNSRGLTGYFTDLSRGYDMLSMDIPERPENCFWHPPYHDIIKYSSNMYDSKEVEAKYGYNPEIDDLSRCKDWDDFVKKMNYCMLKQFTSLEKGGRMFVLMGDIKKKGVLYSMLADIAKPGTLEQIIIKMQHNCVSDRTTYSRQNFVPIVHEYLMVCRKDEPMIIPVMLSVRKNLDMRDSLNTTWRDTVLAVFQHYGKEMSLQELYEELAPHKKAKANPHWKEKIRQTLRDERYFKRISEGIYQAA